MSQKNHFRSDNIDYKELLKRREEKRKQLAIKKNPFILCKLKERIIEISNELIQKQAVQETDQETYAKLYKFNPQEILNEFSKNSGEPAGPKTALSEKKLTQSLSRSRHTDTNKTQNKSKISEKPNNIGEAEFEGEEDQQFFKEEDGDEEDNYYQKSDENAPENGEVFTQIIHDLFNDAIKKPANKIQNALFVDAYVAAEQAKIITGEQAISFFAKYGNTTPIKFINCVKDDSNPPEKFRPYDLKVNTVSENQKELTLDEYYTISAHGIVHVFTLRGKKALGTSDTSTEVISLSDWMHESTMFNIITNIQFFKNYAITKIFNIWKANVHYRIFCKTRKRLVLDSFIAKPAFAQHLLTINQHMYEIQNTKTVSNSIVQSKIWDQEEFKADQKKARQEAQRNYEGTIEKVITLVEVVCKEVDSRTKIKDQAEMEEARFGQQVKSKPRYEIALEAKERAYLLERAIKDREKLRNFIRLVDYLSVETLVQTNQLSMQTLLEEMKKERKQGLFGSSVIFDEARMSFAPDEKEVTDSLVTLLEDMVTTMQSNSLRVIFHFETYIKNLNVETVCDVAKIIFDSVEFELVKDEIVVKIQTDFESAQKFVDEKYEKCRPIHNFRSEWNFETFRAEEQKIETIKQRITELNRWQLDISNFIKDVVQGVVQVQGSKIKQRLEPFVKEQLELIREYLVELMKKKADSTLRQLHLFNNNLSKPPTTLKEYANYIMYFNEIKEAMKDNKLERKKAEIEEMHFELKQKFSSFIVDTSDTVTLEEIQEQYLKIQQVMIEGEEEIKAKKGEMIQKFEGEVARLSKDIKNIALSVNQPTLCTEETAPSQALSILTQIKVQIEGNQAKGGGEQGGLQGRNKTLAQYASLMQITQQETKEIKDLEAKYNDRTMLWTHFDEFQRSSQEWICGAFNGLNSEDVEKAMKKFKQGIGKLKMNIHNLSSDEKDRVLEVYQLKYTSFESNMPIIVALGNKDLQVRHWKKIFDILQLNISPGQQFTLSELIQSSAIEKIEDMEEISGRASGEAGIERQVEEIKKKWQELNFIVSSYRDYKDKFILGTVEDIIAALDDHQLKVQTMLGTKFVAEIRPVVEEWEKKLVLISDIIDEWLYCQRQWMYLENIFSAEDIQKQLPQETTKFMQVDKFWKEIMIKTNKRPLVQECCSNEDLLKKFQLYNKMLEDIQKCLENYLETKRASFPRFYFLSNDELLEILSQTRNPHAVQGHLRKCFDNINRIQFTEVDESKEIVAMQSAEPETMPEKVPFFASVFAEGAVEHWLFRIQEMMVKSLHSITKKAYLEYPDNGLERTSWLFKYPAQPVLTVDQIKWTEGCTEALIKMSQGKATGLKEYNDFMILLIVKMVATVRGQLNTLERTMMGALIVLDVHARDVVSNMTELNVSHLNDFEWSKQLRYYWEAEEDNCFVRQTNTRFKYRFEYLGNGPRLVITPLTDKCYITLTSAKYLSYGGAPAGPAGTGKTETTKDLAKALAVQCVVFNCSDGLDFKTMGRFFSGLSQSGAWACFDEFNRIDIEVLSVIAQQILTIQVAIRKNVDTFEFEGRTIPIDQSFGVFITMNPGYAGRTELPDNLKALFRPVAMMIPDYRLIAEIILFSEGFSTASILARKMVNLYKLSSEQLSKQDHYDFGMRAVKSVLVMAGALRRKESSLQEEIVLIRAMRDSNVPKFLEHDLPLFMSIISDLFPGVDIPYIDYGNLQKAIENQLVVQNYQKPAKFITKIIQLMETIMVRHGVMVVGITGTGKSTNIHTLARAMLQLEKEGSTDYYHKQVKLETLNPKSVTMNELFGYTNLMTNEWTDGIAAKIIRDNVTEATDLKKWIIFDGPVDAIWIENMNTVLDDNKMLCLNNGQRIKLPATFTMMFEVQDLAVASPATVSRCGMVFMEPVHLGWEPIVDTWSIKFKEQITKEGVSKDAKAPAYLTNLVEKVRSFFRDNLKFLRGECKEVIQTVDNNLVASCLNMIEIVYAECIEIHNLDKLPPNEADQLCSMIFIFSFVWSAGGNLHDSSRQKFSQVIKGKILKILTGFPFDGDVFDYYINFEKKEFKPWTELITEFKFNKEVPFFNILVPTADTVKFKNVLSKLLKNGRNVLLSGETGTGKSVIIQEFLGSLNPESFVYSVLNFSAQTKSQNLQDLFMDKDKFQRKKKDLLGPPAGRKMIVFIDDVNMPALESYGAQPPNELFRQIIDQGGFYDLKKLYFMNIKDCCFVSACGPPDGGRNPVSPRLFRHFNMLWAPELSQRSMETIFMHILKGFLLESPTKGLEKLAPSIVKTTVDMYLRLKEKFLPTPKKSHYTFNLRDISKVFQGILQIRYENCPDKEMLLSLWAHECQRVFADRLVDDVDKNNYLEYLVNPLKDQFELQWDKPHLSSIIFGDYSNNQRLYIRIEEPEKLSLKFNEYLGHYNSQQKVMNLVFFQDAIMHLSRACRILRQPRGNSLMIGVGGSGRQSMTRMATFICQYECFSIEITKSYKDPQWKDDLKKLLKNAGAKNTAQVFLFSDTQIVMESFLEDINNILNTGEVPNLWMPEDLEEIIGEIRPLAKENKIEETRDKILKFFVQLVRENLHIVLTFSPVGSKLRDRCRQFPSIINCCGTDWYDKWPEEALYSVAIKEYTAQERLGIQDFVQKLSKISVEIHRSVQVKTVEFFEQLRRYNYVTPTSYLELIKLYIDMMKVQQNILPLKISKYTVGLQTLAEANREVANLQAKIIAFQPELEKSAKENAILVKEIEGKKEVAAVEAAKCKTETDAAQIIRDDVNQQRQSCQKELDEALPILEQANNAVKKIEKKMIDEMKSFKAPPAMVGIVMNAVCLLYGEKEEWDAAKKLLGRMNFLESLIEFQPETVNDKKWQKLRVTYLNDPKFTKENVSNVSLAATSLLIWVLAIEKFAKVKKIVGPKEIALKEAESKLKVVEAQLYEKESALREIQEMVQDLEKKFEMSVRKAEMLKQQKNTAEIQLSRAEKLVSGLAGEAERWKVSEAQLKDDFKNITGNMLISAASIAYLGPFVFSYRKDMIKEWVKECVKVEIPVALDFNLSRILAEEVQIREWQEHGLPADDLSTENGIFIFNCRRWPLVIDPQGQANKWIKHLGADNNLQTTKLTEPNFLKTLENSIRFGQPVLLENIEEELDPALEPILLKQIFKRGAQQMLRLGDQDVPYNHDFKFYMTTKLPNPHYIPEVCIKTTIINFTVTPQGLEDQLLVEVVRHERVELEEKRVSLILQVSQDKRQLQELEDRILKLISEAQAQNKILEDEELINTLDQSKFTSNTVNQRIEQSRKTQIEINQTRELYRPVAKRGSVLYFVIAGLSTIDPMYQYSLEFFIRLFKLRLAKAENPPELTERLKSLLEDVTRSFFINICRESKNINTRDWSFFIRGPSQDPQIDEANIPPFLNSKQFSLLSGLSEIGQVYKGIPASLKDPEHAAVWTEILENKDPWKCSLPQNLASLEPFQKLLMLKQLKEEKLILLVRNYVLETLGELFTKSPQFDLKGSFSDSTSTTPIIFVLSPGADPISYLYQLAKEKDFDQRLKSLSLGQGQGEIAKEMIKTGRRNGDWVCLQNCHLAISWMTELERIQEMQVEADTHPDFRLWLTSMPSTKFPVPVLQSGIKLTNEPPKGLKANLGRTFNEVDDKEYESCTKRTEYQRLLFSLGFFHAVILERRKFGAIGWNIPYEWMNSDFETCQKQLMIYLNQQPEIPWETLNYLISEINYGGRVTDDKDVRLITALLRKYFNPKIMGDRYDFSLSGVYHSPLDLQLASVRAQVEALPAEDDPEVFGLHSNASITFEQKTVKEFFDTLLLGQPRSSGKSASGETPDDIVFKLADKVLQEIPELLEQVKLDNPNSLEVFRFQEVLQFNRLLSTIKKTLAELKKAIKGLVVMSITLERMFDSFLLKRVPANWEKVAYPSLKPLGTWVTDLSQRIEFFRIWVKQGQVSSYWVSAMFFPQGFMTSALQTYARRTMIAIDTLTFRTEVRHIRSEEVTDVPEIGVNIHGLFVEGCGWNVKKAVLQESQIKQLFESMPVLWLEPVKLEAYIPKDTYKCPLYKTSTRRGTLSTTGHSTNFVMYMDLQTEVDHEHWIRRGVALLCQLDD